MSEKLCTKLSKRSRISCRSWYFVMTCRKLGCLICRIRHAKLALRAPQYPCQLYTYWFGKAVYFNHQSSDKVQSATHQVLLSVLHGISSRLLTGATLTSRVCSLKENLPACSEARLSAELNSAWRAASWQSEDDRAILRVFIWRLLASTSASKLTTSSTDVRGERIRNQYTVVVTESGNDLDEAVVADPARIGFTPPRSSCFACNLTKGNNLLH